ncbi:MAG: hypothetical protein HYY21_11540, partial [Candidatus Tectomicrobia bacterium]|nr:hypothetical protein [Candidatus Tectomicrobia bacterium]
GFCVLGLAEALVVVSGLNEQNLLGTKQFLDLVMKEEEKPLLLVLSPVPTAEEELKAQRLQRAEKLLGKIGARISYHPYIALSEEPFIAFQPEHFVAEEFRRVARAILALVGDSPDTLLGQQALQELLSRDEIEKALDNLRRAAPFERGEVIQILRLLTTQILQAKGGAPPWANDAFSLLTRLDPKDDIAFGNWGSHLGALARLTAKAEGLNAARPLFKEAFQKYQKATDIKTDFHEAFYNWGNDLGMLARLTAQSDLNAAKPLFQEAFEKYKKALKIKPDTHEALGAWGLLLALYAEKLPKKEWESADSHFQKAEKRLREAIRLSPGVARYREGLTAALNDWAKKLEDAGQIQAARKKRESAERLEKEIQAAEPEPGGMKKKGKPPKTKTKPSKTSRTDRR